MNRHLRRLRWQWISPSRCIWPILTSNKTQRAVKWLLSEIKPREAGVLTELKPETQHSLCRATFKLKLSERNERRGISAVIIRTQYRTSVASEQSLQKPMISLITVLPLLKHWGVVLSYIENGVIRCKKKPRKFCFFYEICGEGGYKFSSNLFCSNVNF